MSDFLAEIHQIRFRLRLRPSPPLGELTALPDPVTELLGAGCLSPITPPPLSALLASIFGLSGLNTLGPSGLDTSSQSNFLHVNYRWANTHPLGQIAHPVQPFRPNGLINYL